MIIIGCSQHIANTLNLKNTWILPYVATVSTVSGMSTIFDLARRKIPKEQDGVAPTACQ